MSDPQSKENSCCDQDSSVKCPNCIELFEELQAFQETSAEIEKELEHQIDCHMKTIDSLEKDRDYYKDKYYDNKSYCIVYEELLCQKCIIQKQRCNVFLPVSYSLTIIHGRRASSTNFCQSITKFTKS